MFFKNKSYTFIFKNEIINRSSKKTFNKIQKTFDDILKFEENIIILNNKIFTAEELAKQAMEGVAVTPGFYDEEKKKLIRDFFTIYAKEEKAKEKAEFTFEAIFEY